MRSAMPNHRLDSVAPTAEPGGWSVTSAPAAVRTVALKIENNTPVTDETAKVAPQAAQSYSDTCPIGIDFNRCCTIRRWGATTPQRQRRASPVKWASVTMNEAYRPNPW